MQRHPQQRLKLVCFDTSPAPPLFVSKSVECILHLLQHLLLLCLKHLSASTHPLSHLLCPLHHTCVAILLSCVCVCVCVCVCACVVLPNVCACVCILPIICVNMLHKNNISYLRCIYAMCMVRLRAVYNKKKYIAKHIFVNFTQSLDLHSLHLLLTQLCWQMPVPPHTLHSYLRRLCSHICNPLHSLHWAFTRF